MNFLQGRYFWRAMYHRHRVFPRFSLFYVSEKLPLLSHRDPIHYPSSRTPLHFPPFRRMSRFTAARPIYRGTGNGCRNSGPRSLSSMKKSAPSLWERRESLNNPHSPNILSSNAVRSRNLSAPFFELTLNSTNTCSNLHFEWNCKRKFDEKRKISKNSENFGISSEGNLSR